MQGRFEGVSACWICIRGHTSASPEPVGCCKICSILACDGHGDRLKKGQFWCYVCLQLATVDRATGQVTLKGEPLSDDDLVALLGETQHRSPVNGYFGELEGLLSPSFVDSVAAQRGVHLENEVAGPLKGSDLVRLGAAFLSTCVGSSRWMTEGPEGQEAEFIQDYGHPFLNETMGLGTGTAIH